MSSTYKQGLFTLGVPPETFDLPHRRLDIAIILLVRRVVARAFQLLRERGFNLANCTEDQITAAIRGIIENDLRQSGAVPGFNKRVFESVTRQQQVENFDLSKLSKAPDLCFKLRNYEDESRALSTHDALFVECKPVDSDHSTGGDYCDLGIQRFVDGDYAWAMQDAIMIGYVRNKRSIATHLMPVIQKSPRKERLKIVELPRALVDGNITGLDALHLSRHARGFPWIYGKGAATDVFVYHSWYPCD
ncbi:MAG TPA: hypothetical protein VHE81_13905 [Lacipirellulaceae bacterium]|nr:hypothetical protein [Lacipirellulaceae bacterium]